MSAPQAPFTFFDNPEMMGNPFPMFAGLRQNAPVFKPPGGNMWMVTTYEDALRVIRDPQTFSSEVGQAPAEGESRPPTILFDDPPMHTRMRGLLTGAFTPRVIEQQRRAIEENCKIMVDQMLEGETTDFIAGIAYPLPVMVIAAMLGVQDGDMATFKRWSDAIIENVASALFEPGSNAIEEINREFDAYFSKQLDKLRAAPEDNLLSALIHAKDEDGSQLSQSDLLVICRVLLVAGNETTTGVIVNVARVFTAFPEVLGQLKEHPELIPSMIEETLRRSGKTIHIFYRNTYAVDSAATLPRPKSAACRCTAGIAKRVGHPACKPSIAGNWDARMSTAAAWVKLMSTGELTTLSNQPKRIRPKPTCNAPDSKASHTARLIHPRLPGAANPDNEDATSRQVNAVGPTDRRVEAPNSTATKAGSMAA